jgi:hypothetical protein
MKAALRGEERQTSPDQRALFDFEIDNPETQNN